tara:strand:+ start:58 stop:339 length:282 start_codon:yes stop_codon:yes gene_type:complete
MAFRVTCDIAACGAEIQSGPGQPMLAAKKDVYCERCAGHIAAVEIEVAREANRLGWKLVEEINALRQQKIEEALPAQKGGHGVVPEWRIEPAS